MTDAVIVQVSGHVVRLLRPGEQGPAGPVGPAGAAGSHWYSGAGAPAAGLTAAVEAAIAAGSTSLRIMWEDSQTFHRHHPMVVGVQQALGKTSAELDVLWQAAMGVQL